MAEVDRRGQDPVDEDELVLGTGADSSPTWSRDECRPMPLVPQRADLRDEFGDHLRIRSGDLLTADDRRTRPVPHHADRDR
ncbi:hypothetical protein [Streptomyces sp. NPDC004685]